MDETAAQDNTLSAPLRPRACWLEILKNYGDTVNEKRETRTRSIRLQRSFCPTILLITSTLMLHTNLWCQGKAPDKSEHVSVSVGVCVSVF